MNYYMAGWSPGLFLGMEECKPLFFYCLPSEMFPNSKLPVIVYRDVLPGTFLRRVRTGRILARNGWTNVVVRGIATNLHYHSNNHVVIGVLRGSTDIALGGYRGHLVGVGEGDIVIIPAGVAYKSLGSEHMAACMMAWPGGVEGDVNVGAPGERPAADMRIASVVNPVFDPVYGLDGAVSQVWKEIRK